MLASFIRRQGYQQITEIPPFVAGTRVADVTHSFGCNEQTIYRLQTRFQQPGSKNDKSPLGRPRITTPFEARVIVTST